MDTNVAAGRYLQNQANIIEYSSLTAAPRAWRYYDRSVSSGDSAHYTALRWFEKVGAIPESSKSVRRSVLRRTAARFAPPSANA